MAGVIHDVARDAEPRRRRQYEPPRLEHLGPWSALTLQQSVPIAFFFADPAQGESDRLTNAFGPGA